jgi:NADH:ubiquinone oxidoreductase subunit F (NADH-binding)
VVIANGAEGEPLSRKDQWLMACRPHLVIDGAMLAAESVGARRVVFYLGEEHGAARGAMARALAERPPAEQELAVVLAAPGTYVAGEESAAVHFVNWGVAVPTAVPPRRFQHGVEGRPTLVQNVETLAHVALIARYGDGWFQSLGRGGVPGTLLITLSGAVHSPGVVEVPGGVTLGEAMSLAGGARPRARAVLLGGYFGGWIDPVAAQNLRLDAPALRATGASLGCGVVSVLDVSASPLAQTAAVMRHLAAESAAQCGPCFFGLRSLAGTVSRLAEGRGECGDMGRLQRWATMVRGRGACRHPDGAAGFLDSALRVFEPEFAAAEGLVWRRAA